MPPADIGHPALQHGPRHLSRLAAAAADQMMVMCAAAARAESLLPVRREYHVSVTASGQRLQGLVHRREPDPVAGVTQLRVQVLGADEPARRCQGIPDDLLAGGHAHAPGIVAGMRRQSCRGSRPALSS
jgi:hypothetical protein